MVTEDDPRHAKNFKGFFGGTLLQASFSFSNTGGGNEAEQRQTGQELTALVYSTVERWAATESRPGGKLAGRRS